MKNYDLNEAFEAVDLQEFCEMMCENGYRLVRMKKAEVEDGDGDGDPFGDSNPQLVSALKEWRYGKSKAENVPAYCVLTNRTLQKIARNAPSTIGELLSIGGFGPMKADKYGQEILAIVAREMEVCREQE